LEDSKKYKSGMNAPPIWKSFVLGGKFCEGRVSGVSLWRPMALQDFAVAVVVGEQDNKEGGTHRHDRHGSHAQVKDMRAPTTPNCGKKNGGPLQCDPNNHPQCNFDS